MRRGKVASWTQGLISLELALVGKVYFASLPPSVRTAFQEKSSSIYVANRRQHRPCANGGHNPSVGIALQVTFHVKVTFHGMKSCFLVRSPRKLASCDFEKVTFHRYPQRRVSDKFRAAR